VINQKNTTVLIVPGLRDHVEQHWQTLLCARLSKVKIVPPLESDKLSLASRVKAIHATIEAITGPIIVVAHSAGTLMLAHWAAHHGAPIQAALLAAPPDFDAPMPAPYPNKDQLI
jgi:predicted alpha/beta hydrolase family esterase